jgi:protein-disulfide isomerase
MQHFIESSGYKILSAEFVITPPQCTELAAHWKKMPAIIKTVLDRSQYGSVYQVVMKVAPTEFDKDGIKLEDLPIPKSVTTPKEALRSWLGPYLGQKIHRFFLRRAL